MNMSLSKRNEITAGIQSVLQEAHQPNARAILFGSRARGDARKDSDWDILILVDSANAVAALGIWDVVANRIFYAAFHAVSALLIHDHIEVRSHKGAGLMFGQKYVIPRHRSGQWLYGHQ